MDKEEISRRLFLIKSCSGASAAWLCARWPEIVAAQEHAHKVAAAGAHAGFEFFTPAQAAEVEAVAAQVIPTDDTPGAREARVIYFIDRALMTFDSDKQPLYIKGLGELQARAKSALPGAKRFSDLDPRRQMKLLEGIETVMGFFADPEYGGNYDRMGWKHIGFEDRHYFKPPFGYYDRQYNGQK
jgi:gluconate 2-dehydrogenase gamma chain